MNKSHKNNASKYYIAALSLITIALLIVISIGISSAQSNSTQDLQSVSLKPQQFHLQAAYAYVGKGPQNDTSIDQIGNKLSPVSEYPSTVIFNVTKPTIENETCDAVLEVFNVTIAADSGIAEKFVYFIGTNYNASFSDDELNTLTCGIYDLFDQTQIDAVRGNFRFNWTENEPLLSTQIGSYGIYTDYIHGAGLWSNGRPNAVTVTFHRLGNVVMTNGAVSAQPDTESANNRSQAQLQRYNDSFLINEMIPQSQLSQIDKFKPFL